MSEKRERILSVRNLKQYFKSGSGKNKLVVKAVDGISFDIYKGEVFSLVGESGCGKTTTARTIIKLYKATGGEVHFLGQRIVSDVKSAKEKHKEIMSDLIAERNDKKAELKEKLKDSKISKADYTAELNKVNEKFNREKQKSLNVYLKAKRDAKFEKIVDQDSVNKVKKGFETLPEYQAIEKRYKELGIELNEKIAKLKQELSLGRDDKKEIAKELTNLQKEVKLNAIRKKQDFAKLKYGMIRKNRILMRQMQMIFQDPISSLNPRMTVKEIIAEGLRINGVKNEKEIDQRVDDALTTVGLVPEHAGRYPHEFSGGQRQRIGIARALIVEPKFIIADEPVSALDVSVRAQVINLLNDLREERGITILFIAHDLSVVKYFSDRLAVMYYGHIVEIGDKNALFNHPLHPYTISLMDSIPLPDPVYERNRKKKPRYNPAKEHDYSKEKPSLREIEPDHFVLCNTEEFNKYLEKIKGK